MIIQIEATLTGWGLLWTWVQTSGIWSEEERTLNINLLKLLVIKLALFSFAKRKRMKAIHFQINNKTALSYLSKMGNKERTYAQTEQRVLVLSSKSQYVYHSRISVFSTEYSSKQGIKKKTALFRVASSFQNFQAFSRLLGSPTIDLFASCLCHQLPQYIAWNPDSYSQGADAMIQNLNMGLLHTFPPFSMISRVLLKLKQECFPFLVLLTPVCSTQPW